MKDNNMAYYPLQTIRKVINVPFKFLGLTMNEISLMLKLFALGYVFGVVAQTITNILSESQPLIMYYFLLIVPMAHIIFKQINKKYGEGLSFFVIADFQAKDYPFFESITNLTYIKK